MPRVRLTDRFVDTVTVTERTEFWDTAKGSSLVLRVGPKSPRNKHGSKAWSVVYRRRLDGKKQRLSLGNYPKVSLADARDAASAALRNVAIGGDPAGDKSRIRKSETVKELGEAFVKDYAKPKLRSWQEIERIWTANVNPVLGEARAMAVTEKDVQRVIAAKVDAGKLTMADRTLAVMRKAFGWAVQKRGYPENPVEGLKVEDAPKTKRERFLTHSEIRMVWAVEGVVGDALRFMLLTGQRSSEVCGLVAGEVDLESQTWTIPGSRTKNKRDHSVALSPAAIEILKRRIAGARKDGRLFTRAGVQLEHRAVAKQVRGLQAEGDRFTPHDLRRTVATGMAEMDVGPHIVEAVLNHISGHRSGVAGVYNHAEYLPQRRAALLAWERKLLSIVGIAQGNVIPFSAAQHQ